jgi:hypothetical protein
MPRNTQGHGSADLGREGGGLKEGAGPTFLTQLQVHGWMAVASFVDF